MNFFKNLKPVYSNSHGRIIPGIKVYYRKLLYLVDVFCRSTRCSIDPISDDVINLRFLLVKFPVPLIGLWSVGLLYRAAGASSRGEVE